MTAFYIGIAGGLGSMCRYLLGRGMAELYGHKTQLPVGTLAVNLLGSLLMGVLIAIFTSRGEMDSRMRLVLTIGFLGGFTTYSSFALETVGLLENRNLAVASLYVSLTLVSAGIACFIGLSLGRRL